MKKRAAAPLRRRIAEWLETTRGLKLPIGISPAVARRRAQRLRQEILRGKTTPWKVAVDEDFKSILHALVRLVTESRPHSTAAHEAGEVQRFVRAIRWKSDTFGEKQELLRQLDVHRARLNLIVLGTRVRRVSSVPLRRDPFQKRPPVAPNSPDPLVIAKTADAQAKALAARILEVALATPEEIDPLLANLDLDSQEARASLLLSLAEAGLEITRDPPRILRLGRKVLESVHESPRRTSRQVSEKVLVPIPLISAWAHRVIGGAYVWLGDFRKSEVHFRRAYALVAKTGGTPFAYAAIEIVESGARSLTGKGAGGLLLARRARRTFESLGLADYTARAWVGEGLALFALGRLQKSVTASRRAIPVFERLSLWPNYIGAVNNLATTLTALGRLPEARREYARALKRLSSEKHESWATLVRHGMADLLFASGRYADAAKSFGDTARLYARFGPRYGFLKARLREIESWVRAGEIELARQCFDVLEEESNERDAIGPSILRRIKKILSGSSPDSQKIEELRRTAERDLVLRVSSLSHHRRKG